jgi:hypothetical protein
MMEEKERKRKSDKKGNGKRHNYHTNTYINRDIGGVKKERNKNRNRR